MCVADEERATAAQVQVSMARTLVAATVVLLIGASSANRRLQPHLTSHWDRGPPPLDLQGPITERRPNVLNASDVRLSDSNFNQGVRGAQGTITERLFYVTNASDVRLSDTDFNQEDRDPRGTIRENVYPQRTIPERLLNIFNASDIRLSDSNMSATEVNATLALQRRLEMSTEFFLVPERPSTTPSTTSSGHIIKTVCTGCAPISGMFRNEVWVIPVLALSALTMLLIVGFEVFVLCKACQTTPSRRHLFLGQMLLLGLFSGAGLGGVIALTPSQATCAIMRFGTGVSYAIVFASLLVKCVFLISLNGGVYLPAPYQGLLLLFAVLIQVAIGAQWLLTSPPVVDTIPVEVATQHKHRLLVTAEDLSSSVNVPLCRTPYSDMLFSLIYIVFLILFVAVLAFKSRSIRDNYREATYIGLSVGCAIPTWLVWVFSGFIVGDRHKDACLAFGLVISSAMVFLIMFMPKGRQLAAMGKEGLYMEDREERFSSLSHAGSGYSPSFFHFKPMKYGVEPHKRHHTVTTLGGDRAALYPAPPSYSRIFHCYPNPPRYYPTRFMPGSVFMRSEDGNVYTTLEPTLSSNPNVYFQRGNGVHPGMMY